MLLILFILTAILLVVVNGMLVYSVVRPSQRIWLPPAQQTWQYNVVCKHSRNPQYIGDITTIAGGAILSASPWAIPLVFPSSLATMPLSSLARFFVRLPAAASSKAGSR